MKLTKQGLETASNAGVVAVLVLCALWLAPQVKRQWAGDVGRATSSSTATGRMPTSYVVGDRAPELPTLNYKQASKTLVLFVRNDCRYCTASMPFYRRLASSDAHAHNRFRMVAASLQATEETQEYVAAYTLAVDQIVTHESSEDVKVFATPTLLLVDQAGKVLNVWVGKQSTKNERLIEEALGG